MGGLGIRPCLAILLAAAATVSHANAGDCDFLDDFGAAPSGATCSTYLTASSGSGTSCHWPFPFRAQAARDFADATWRTITTCRTGHAPLPDSPVNHPDSYDLRSWVSGDAVYSVSVKDKTALRQTLVFVRREQRPAATQ